MTVQSEIAIEITLEQTKSYFLNKLIELENEIDVSDYDYEATAKLEIITLLKNKINLWLSDIASNNLDGDINSHRKYLDNN